MGLARALASALFALTLGAPASAQTPTPGPALAADHIAAAHDFYRSIVFDTGMIETLSNGIGAQIMPGIRESTLNSELYRAASAEHQAALRAFVETMPQLMLEECNIVFTELGERAAPRFAERLSAEHLHEIAAFMRTPHMRELWQAMLKAYLDGGDAAIAGLLPNWGLDSPAFVAFAETDAGRALEREMDNINRILDEEIAISLRLAMPRIQMRIFEGMCDALGDECPDELRRRINRI